MRILVPLDGSALAERALPCAAMLARAMRAHLFLLRAISLPTDVTARLGRSDPLAKAAWAQIRAEAAEYLGGIAQRLRADKLREDDKPIVHAVRAGDPASAIVDHATQIDAELIVMATHGYSGITRWRHGSVAERVLQSADVPVLMVCAGAEPTDTSCKRILVPLDGSPLAEQVLPLATAVARAFEAQIILFQVAIAQTSGAMMGEWFVPLEGIFESAQRDAGAYLGRVADGLRKEGLTVSTAITVGAVADSIIGYAEANDIDLVAMCTHGRTGLSRWTMGSVADRVVRARCTPVLLVRATRDDTPSD